MRIPVKKNPQLSSRTDLSRTNSIRASSPGLSHAVIGRLPNTLLKNCVATLTLLEVLMRMLSPQWVVLFSSATMLQRALTQLLRHCFLRCVYQLTNRLEHSQPKKILEVFWLLTTVLISTVSLMLISVKQQNQKPQRVKLKQKQKKIIRRRIADCSY